MSKEEEKFDKAIATLNNECKGCKQCVGIIQCVINRKLISIEEIRTYYKQILED